VTGNWEGNRRSGVALAIRHKLKWFIHLWALDLSKGDEHPANSSWGVLYLYLISSYLISGRSRGSEVRIAIRPYISLFNKFND